jgi:hypothetical protein
MKKMFFVFMLSVAFIVGTSAIAKAQDETITNQDIIAMTKAGLDKMVIIGKIRSSKSKFDLSTNGLIELKKENVDDAVVHSMLEASTGAVVSTPATNGPSANMPAAGDPNDPAAPHGFGIYLYEERDGQRTMTRMDPNVSAQNRTGGQFTQSITPFGLGKVKQKANLPGNTAKLQVKDSQPVFYFYLDANSGGLNTASGIPSTPNEFTLVKFNVRDDNREITISKSNSWGSKGGLSDESVMTLKSEPLGNGVFKISPQAPLKNGEYGFYLVNSGNSNTANGIGSKFFDFGVRMLP